jgi:aminopeptidase
MKPALLLTLVACPLLAQTPPAVPTVAAAVRVTAPVDPLGNYRDPRLPGRALAAAGASFEWGGGTYRFASGTLWELAAADGSPIGLYFEGSGSLSWAAGDEAAARVYAENAKRVGGVSAAPGGLAASFSRASFLYASSARPKLPELAASGAAPPVDAFRQHRKRFADDRDMPPEAGLAVAAANGTAFAEAFLESGKDLRHRVDAAAGLEETLTAMDRPSGTPSTFPGWRYGAVIARRPVGHPRRTPPGADVRLTDLAIDVHELEGGWGRFAVEETFAADRPVRALALALRSDILQSRTLSAVSAKLMSAARGGTLLPAVLEKDTLVVVLPEAVPAGSTVKLSIRYEAPYLSRHGGDNLWELPIAGAWYPQPAALRSASRHTFHAVIRAKKPLVPFASGDTVRRAVEGDENVVETRLDRPVPFVAALAGAYTVQEEAQDGVVCRVASYGVSKERSGARLTNLFHRMRKFYEPYFGAFPWREYTIVEVPSYGFGQAPPGMMRITQEAFQANVIGGDAEAAFFSAGINERLAHEIAHSWWGYGVWGATPNDQWIEESFAETSAARLIEEMKDRADFTRLANVWRTRAKEASSLAPIALANDVSRKVEFFDSSDLWVDRFYLTYFKGAVLLQAIRKEIGDDAFFTVLKSFQRSFEKKPAVTTDQFVGLLSYVTKKDWKPWFEKYYYGTEVP